MNRPLVYLAALSLSALAVEPVSAASSYEYVSAPAIDLNRVYRVDKASGEVGACQYGLKEGTIGETLCYPPGEGAKAQTSSEYSLVISHHQGESGVFRVDLRSGAMSICYVLNGAVVCTPPSR